MTRPEPPNEIPLGFVFGMNANGEATAVGPIGRSGYADLFASFLEDYLVDRESVNEVLIKLDDVLERRREAFVWQCDITRIVGDRDRFEVSYDFREFPKDPVGEGSLADLRLLVERWAEWLDSCGGWHSE